MAVRPLIPADISRVLELNNDAVPAVGALDESELQRLVDHSALALAVTVADVTPGDEVTPGDDPAGRSDTLAGFCLVLSPGVDYASVNYRWFSERYDDFAYLDRVVIDPAQRGRGLGRALYDRVEASTAATWFLLEVNLRPRNDASLVFHERLGFAEVGQQETPYGALVSMQAKRLR